MTLLKNRVVNYLASAYISPCSGFMSCSAFFIAECLTNWVGILNQIDRKLQFKWLGLLCDFVLFHVLPTVLVCLLHSGEELQRGKVTETLASFVNQFMSKEKKKSVQDLLLSTAWPHDGDQSVTDISDEVWRITVVI